MNNSALIFAIPFIFVKSSTFNLRALLRLFTVLSIISGYISVIGLGLAAIWFLYNSLQFLKDNSDLKARRVMFASFVYLPVVLLSLVLDKYF